MNAILDFARFLSSGYFVGDLGFILGGVAVVVCVWGALYGVLSGWVGFVRGVLSEGVLSGGFCPGGFLRGGGGGFVRGLLSWGFCPGDLVRGGGGLSRGVLSTGSFVRGVLSGGVLSGGFCQGGGVCPRILLTP